MKTTILFIILLSSCLIFSQESNEDLITKDKVRLFKESQQYSREMNLKGPKEYISFFGHYGILQNGSLVRYPIDFKLINKNVLDSTDCLDSVEFYSIKELVDNVKIQKEFGRGPLFPYERNILYCNRIIDSIGDVNINFSSIKYNDFLDKIINSNNQNISITTIKKLKYLLTDPYGDQYPITYLLNSDQIKIDLDEMNQKCEIKLIDNNVTLDSLIFSAKSIVNIEKIRTDLLIAYNVKKGIDQLLMIKVKDDKLIQSLDINARLNWDVIHQFHPDEKLRSKRDFLDYKFQIYFNEAITDSLLCFEIITQTSDLNPEENQDTSRTIVLNFNEDVGVYYTDMEYVVEIQDVFSKQELIINQVLPVIKTLQGNYYYYNNKWEYTWEVKR